MKNLSLCSADGGPAFARPLALEGLSERWTSHSDSVVGVALAVRPGKWPKIQAGWSPIRRPFLVFAGAAPCDLRLVKVTRKICRVLQWIVWSYMAPHGDLLL